MFFMHMNYDGLASGDVRVDNEEVLRKLETFGARIERLGAFAEVAAWSKDN
jgi:hypothetical protein